MSDDLSAVHLSQATDRFQPRTFRQSFKTGWQTWLARVPIFSVMRRYAPFSKRMKERQIPNHKMFPWPKS